MRRILALLVAFTFISALPIVGYHQPKDSQEQIQKSRMEVIHSEWATLDANLPKRRTGDWTAASAKSSIDNLLFQKMNTDGVPINSICDDATFVRRVHLILTGRLPDPEKTRSFLADKRPDKRAILIDEVLASEAYQTHWAFWSQEYFQSTGNLLFGGLSSYNSYLFDAIASDKPLTALAREMLTQTGENTNQGSTNFKVRSTEGARYPLDIYDNIAMNASSKFLGISIECISCHDGAYHLEDINLYLADKKREDFWGMASYFSGTRFRLNRNDQGLPSSVLVMNNATTGYLAESDNGDRPRRQGGLIEPKYIFDDQVEEASGNYLEQIAQKITSDRQFARHWANLLWAEVFGLGLVEPVDGFDPYRLDPNRTLPEDWTIQAFDLGLLEHLTDLFISGGFQLKPYLRTLLNTATFEMDSQFAPGKWQDHYAPYYTRFLVRRLKAESVYDSLVVATGVETPILVATRDQPTQRVYFAHQLPDTSQPRGARQEDLANFLNAFGRGNRYDTPRSNEGGISQALLLMNSEVVHSKLLAEDSRILDYVRRQLPPTTLIEELFLDVLCRQPGEDETRQLLEELATYETDIERVSTVMWLLINRVEFTFVY